MANNSTEERHQGLPALQPVQPGETAVTFGDILNAVVEGKRTVFMVTGAFLLGAILYLMVAKPIYSIDALIQLDQTQKGMSGELEPIAAMLTGDLASEGEIEIIRSRSVIGKTVAELHLDIKAAVKRFPILGGISSAMNARAKTPVEPWLWMSSYGWGGESITIEHLEVPASLTDEELTLVAGENGTFKLLAPDFLLGPWQGQPVLEGRVGEMAESKRFSILVSELTARPGTEFEVTRLSTFETILDYRENLEIEELGRDSGVIQIVLTGSKPERIVATVNSIADHYVRQNIERKAEEARRTLDFIERHQPVVKADLEKAETALNVYQAEHGSIQMDKETQALLDRIIDIESQVASLKLEKEDLRRLFARNHPKMRVVDSKISQLEDRLDELNGQIKGLPETQKELLSLTREVELKSGLYTYLLNRAQELKLVEAGTIGDARIVDRAEKPFEPVMPIPELIIILAIFLGLAMGVTVAVLRKNLNPGVENSEIIEERLGTVVYAVVPHSKAQDALVTRKGKGEASGILALEDPGDVAIESLRGFSANLHFSLAESEKQVILISGVSPGAGKSFISINLAYLLASGGKRVLLADMDIRKGHLHEGIGVNQSLGLTSVLSGEAALEDVIHKTSVNELHFIPAGKFPPNPVDLLMGNRFRALIKEVAADFDFVILDSAPILSVIDPALIGREAGAAFLVVRAGENSLQDINAAFKKFAQSDVAVRGVLLNDLRPKAVDYGGYNYYGYGRYGKEKS